MSASLIVQRHWRKIDVVSVLLMPLSALYLVAAWLHRFAFRAGIFRTYRSRLPVVVVGNLTVGGTGKTPLVIALAKALRLRGWRPGVVSRGYGGKVTIPTLVDNESDVGITGDEAVVIAQNSAAPVVVCAKRTEAVKRLENESVDIILSDDGLQHWALERTVEIAIMDGDYGYGNGLLIPAGPLREPLSRLRSVDIRIRRGGDPADGEYSVRSEVTRVRNLVTGEERALSVFRGRRVTAVAGIHDPDRFFNGLRAQGIEVRAAPFPDHYKFSREDIPDTETLLMTEKDAVKCQAFAQENWWAVHQETIIPDQLVSEIENLVRARIAHD